MSLIFKKIPAIADDYTDCPIAVIQLDGYSPDKIINTITYQDDIYENSADYHRSIALSPSNLSGTISGFPLEFYGGSTYNNIDLLVSEKVNGRTEPLYYSYELQFDSYSITESDILQIYKNNEEKIDPSRYIVQFIGDQTLQTSFEAGQLDIYGRYASGVAPLWNEFVNVTATNSIYRIRLLLPLDFNNEQDFFTIRYNKHTFGKNYPNHLELIELNKLYNAGIDKDFYIDSNATIRYGSNTNIPTTGINTLWVIKDPDSQVQPVSIFSLNSDEYQNDAGSEWNLRMSTGSFLTHGELDGTNKKFFKCSFIEDVNFDNSASLQPFVYIHPTFRGRNLLKVDEKPIYIDENKYIYPNYQIDMYEKYAENTNSVDIESFENVMPTGTLAIDVNGKPAKNIHVASIDRKKGYILLDRNLNTDDQINLFFYVDQTQEITISNLELNPRVNGVYGFGNNKSIKSWQNIGIALRKWPDDGIDSISTDDRPKYYNPYFFDFDNPTSGFYQSSPVSSIIPITPVYDSMIFDPYNPTGSHVDPVNGIFVPICHLGLNKLTKDNIKTTDARVIGGGVHDSSIQKLTNDQLNSYVDIGFYDGEPLPHAGFVIIHIPRAIYDGGPPLVSGVVDVVAPEVYEGRSQSNVVGSSNWLEWAFDQDKQAYDQYIYSGGKVKRWYGGLVGRWMNSDMFTTDNYTDISTDEYERFESSNVPGASGYYQDQLNQGEGYRNALIRWAKTQAGQYLDMLIKKFIPGGTNYLLLDENFNIIRLEI